MFGTILIVYLFAILEMFSNFILELNF